MESMSPPPCPPTVTVRRNPHRKARPTPSSAIPLHQPLFSSSVASDLPSFRLEEILSNIEAQPRPITENLKVYLRIRPLVINNGAKPKAAGNASGAEHKNAWPKASKGKASSKEKGRKNTHVCVTVNDDLHSVTVSPSQAVGSKRIKSEVYEGFSHVFSCEASQKELYDQMLRPLVREFLKGKSGMLAAMGPSGSGKTHTVFGCAREPGMVPLALRHIFSENDTERTFKLSMFEICTEKGKAERMIDLSEHGGDLCMQQSILKGLQEVVVCDAQQAESLISLRMLKRATAMTNSNSQSSRSQCIINIRCVPKKFDGEIDEQGSSSDLTIVDLAGAEREKRTGNHGARLLESNFINNTSMVLGLCLRSLFEHQRNPKRPLQKHFQNSLLTRYLRDYLEGKKRMTLILTVKPGEEDYLDTSFLLRQASPFTKIKYKNIEEPPNVNCNKRPIQALPRAEQLKKMKFSGIEPLTVEENTNQSLPLTTEEVAVKEANDGKKIAEDIEDCNSEGFTFRSKEFAGLEINGRVSLSGSCIRSAESDRELQIMPEFSKALWNSLKQYKEKLEIAEKEIFHLRDSLTTEKTRRFDLENELKELKSRCTCWKEASAEVSVVHTSNATPTDRQEEEGLQESTHYPEDLVIYMDTEKGDKHCDIEETSNLTTAHLSSDHGCVEPTEHNCSLEVNNTSDDNARRDSGSNRECISVARYLSTQAQECESANSHGDCKVPKDLKSKGTQPENGTTDNSSFSLDRGQTAFDAVLSELMASSSESPRKDNSSFSVDEENFRCEEGKVSISSVILASQIGGIASHHDQLIDQQQGLQESTHYPEDLVIYKDTENVDEHCDIEETSNLTTTRLSSHHGCVEASERGHNCSLEDNNTLDDNARRDSGSNGECLSVSQYLSTQECESANSHGDCKVPKDLESKEAQSEKGTTGNSSFSLDRGQTAFDAVLPEFMASSSESPRKDDSSFSVDEENSQHEAGKLDPCITNHQVSVSSGLSASCSGGGEYLDQQQDLQESNDGAEDVNDSKDTRRKEMHSETESTCKLTAACLSNDYVVEGTNENCVVQDPNTSDDNSECVLVGPCLSTQECSSVVNFGDCEDPKDVKIEQARPGNTTNNSSLSLDEVQTASDAVLSESIERSPGSAPQEDVAFSVKEEIFQIEDRKINSPITILPKDSQDGREVQNVEPDLALCLKSVKAEKKPKRRLLPAASVLLKDISIFDINDENEKPKGSRREKNVATHNQDRTQGSISLIHLLRNNLSAK